MILTGYLFRLEDEHQVIELTKHMLTAKLRPEVIQALRQLVQGDEKLRAAVQTLLGWAHELVIPVSQIAAVSMEVIASPPGQPESMALTVKSRHHGGFYIHQIRDLRPEDANRLASEIQKLIVPEF